MSGGNKNRRVAALAGFMAICMVALGFAAVPLYRAFCQATGFAGTPNREIGGQAPGAVVGKIVRVRFDSNVAPHMPWRFQPEQRVERVAVGAREMAFFTATNTSDHPITGRASFNVSPDQAGKYFTKIQCFCFNEQTLKAGETARMPVIYYVDPKMLDDPDASDIDEITLSYTFFPAKDAVDSAATGG